MAVEKYVREDGLVAVLYSPGFGAGWSTWADDEYAEFMLFDRRIVEMVLADANPQKIANTVERLLNEEFDDESYTYTGGANDLTVCWLEPGTHFKVREYDGSESVEDLGRTDYFVA